MPRLKKSPPPDAPAPRARTSSRWAIGRPKKDAATLRSRVLSVRLSADEYERLKGEALAAGIPLPALTRAKVTGTASVALAPAPGIRKAETPELFALRRAVDASGINLNQIARKLHMSGEYVPRELQDAMAAHHEILARILAQEIFD